ncbi:MAG: SMP-30/gluconolactonase/LRE family protein [Pirellulales bacterium]
MAGTTGDEPSQFHFVTDVAQASDGRIFAGQYGQIDQIQEFDPTGKFIRRWGSLGNEPMQFARPQGLLFDKQGLLWVADACNHRIQVFDVSSPKVELVKMFGSVGEEPGKLHYPYGLVFDSRGNLLIAEYGNHRVQKMSPAGESLAVWGSPGSEPGQFNSPWAITIDSQDRVYVLDTLNHRVQRFPASV